jgi:hypothetical protein
MASPVATPSVSRSEDRRMQPNRAAARFVPGQRSKFPIDPTCADSGGLRAFFPHLLSASPPDSSRPLSSFAAASVKNPAGGAPQRVRVTFPSSRLAPSCQEEGDRRFASRLWNSKKLHRPPSFPARASSLHRCGRAASRSARICRWTRGAGASPNIPVHRNDGASELPNRDLARSRR